MRTLARRGLPAALRLSCCALAAMAVGLAGTRPANAGFLFQTLTTQDTGVLPITEADEPGGYVITIPNAQFLVPIVYLIRDPGQNTFDSDLLAFVNDAVNAYVYYFSDKDPSPVPPPPTGFPPLPTLTTSVDTTGPPPTGFLSSRPGLPPALFLVTAFIASDDDSVSNPPSTFVSDSIRVTITSVPEPASATLTGLGAIGVGAGTWWSRRRKSPAIS